MNRSQSRWDSVAGFAVPSEAPEEHPHRGSVVPLGWLRLGGRHLFTVDVKKRLQGEWLGLGFRLALDLRPEVASGELVRLPLRPSPVAVLQRPCEPAPVLAPLDLEQALQIVNRCKSWSYSDTGSLRITAGTLFGRDTPDACSNAVPARPLCSGPVQKPMLAGFRLCSRGPVNDNPDGPKRQPLRASPIVGRYPGAGASGVAAFPGGARSVVSEAIAGLARAP